MMSDVVAVVVYRAKPDGIEEAREAFRQVIEPTHAEPGALTCALTQSDEDPSVFLLLERWISMEAVEEHLKKPYVKAFREAVGGLFGPEPEVFMLSDVPIGTSAKGKI
jgi:quinol monooxygenase YgiN